jgi:hypothetical protein
MPTDNILIVNQYLKRLGFTIQNGILDEAAKQVNKGRDFFQLPFSHQFDELSIFSATLSFWRDSVNPYYRLRQYEATLKYRNGQQEARSLIIHLPAFVGYGVTVKQTYNLLSERPVFTEIHTDFGNVYSTWVKLTFHNYSKERYVLHKCRLYNRVDLDELLKQLPVKDADTEKKRAALISSIKDGDRVLLYLKEKGSYALEVVIDVIAGTLTLQPRKIMSP